MCVCVCVTYFLTLLCKLITCIDINPLMGAVERNHAVEASDVRKRNVVQVSLYLGGRLVVNLFRYQRRIIGKRPVMVDV